MPDTREIERRIDKQAAGALSIVGSGGAMTVAPKNLGELMEFAKMMAVAKVGIRQPFRDNPGACLSLALQAFRWGADPFAVANKAYIVNDQIAYESQLIHAIVNASGVLTKRLRASFDGDGPNRVCIITGHIKGEDEPFEYRSPPISAIPVKNSPLWKGDPDQQLIYYSERAWARRFVPEVLLGIYTEDELRAGEIIDATPLQEAGLLPQDSPAEPDIWEVVDHIGHSYEFQKVESAAEAYRRILVAVGNDPVALRTARENNEHFLQALRDEALISYLTDLEGLYAELAPHDVAQRGLGPVDSSGEDQEPAAPLYNQASQDAPAERSGAEGGNAAGAAPDRPNLELRPEQEQAEDPFWTRQSLKIDPGYIRGSLKPDWERWPAAILPKLRQAQSIPVLTALREYNARNMQLYGEACGKRALAELVDEFNAAERRLLV